MRNIIAISVVLGFSSPLLAQNSLFCEKLLEHPLQDTYSVSSKGSQFSGIKNIACSSEMDTFSEAQSNRANLGIDIPSYFDAVFSSKTDSSNYKTRLNEFCSSSDSELYIDTNVSIENENLNQSIASVLKDCANVVPHLYATVEPTKDLKKFLVTVSKKSGSTEIVDFSAVGSGAVSCSGELQNASPSNPVTINGSATFSCSRNDPRESMIISGNTLSDGALFANPVEIPGLEASVGDVIARMNAVEAQLPHTGMVAFFADEKCPNGWQYYNDLAGRYVVGLLPSAPGSSLAEPVGSALTDRENRAVGRHQHNMPDGSWSDGRGSPAHTDSSSDEFGKKNASRPTEWAGEIEGTNAPYISLRPCIKS